MANSSGPGTGRAQRSGLTQAAILAAARIAIAQVGYERLTLRDVAKAAGLSTGAIFGHFPGKAALFKAATDRDAPDKATRAFLTALAASSGAIGPSAAHQARTLLADLYGSAALPKAEAA